MEELVFKGMTKAIGISNFTITKTVNLLKTAKIVPAVNQGNYNSIVFNMKVILKFLTFFYS